MARTPPKQDPYVTRASLAGLTRYGGQEAALVDLLREAQARRDQGVRSAKSTARGTISVIEKAQPQLETVYRDAGFKGGPVAQDIPLPAGPASFASAQAFEQAGAQRSIGRQAAAAIGGLQEQKVLAQQGATFGALQAERQYGADRQQIGDKATQLQGQRGAFEAQTLLGLVDDGNQRRALDRRQAASLASQDRRAASSQQAARAGREDQQTFQAGENQKSRDAAAANAATRKAAAAGKKNRGRLPGGAIKATPGQHGNFRNEIGRAVRNIRTYGPDDPRGEIAADLLDGVPATKTKKGTTIPAVPAVRAPAGLNVDAGLVASVALDIALDGHVSKNNTVKLHKAGLSLRDLGVPVATKAARQAAHRVVRGLGLPG